MKTIRINEVDIVCSHEIKTHPETHHTTIHVAAEVNGIVVPHAMTIGAIDQPLPVSYGKAELQRDLDNARMKCAQMAESKLRAKRLAMDVE